MFEAIATMSAMGLGLGLVLGVAARKFAVETPPILDELEKLMPGTNCGQCGYPGCRTAAEAIASGSAPVTLCPPGGKALAGELLKILPEEISCHGGGGVDLASMEDTGPIIAFIFEDQCTGCTKCFKRCPTDAIVGASRQIHTVISDACIGCEACVDVCPTKAIIIRQKPESLGTWHWPKPAHALATETSSGIAA